MTSSWMSRLHRFGGYAPVPVTNTAAETFVDEDTCVAKLLVFTGAITTARTVRLARTDVGDDWVFKNATTGGFSVTVVGPTGTSVSVPSGTALHITAIVEGLVSVTGAVPPPTGQIPYGQAWTSADTFSFYTASGGPPLTFPIVTLSELGISWGRFAAAAYGHDTVVGDFATTNTVFTSQAPWASATGTNRNSAAMEWVIPSPAAGGTAGTYGWKIAGTTRATMSTTTFALGSLNVSTTGTCAVGALTATSFTATGSIVSTGTSGACVARFIGAVGMSTATSGDNFVEDNDGTAGEYSQVFEIDTTDATQTTLKELPNRIVTGIRVISSVVMATKTDGSSGFSIGITATYKVAASVCTLIGSVVTTLAASGDACAATYDVSAGLVRIRVTGIAATTYRWGASVIETLRVAGTASNL